MHNTVPIAAGLVWAVGVADATTLSMANRIVWDRDGAVRVRSTPGEGTRMFAHLPQ